MMLTVLAITLVAVTQAAPQAPLTEKTQTTVTGSASQPGVPQSASEAPAEPEESPPAPTLAKQQKTLAAAQKHFSKKRYAKAIELLVPLTESEHSEVSWPATFWLGRTYHQQKNCEGSIRLLQQVADSYEPLAGQAKYWIGHGYMRRRRYATAERCFAEGFRLSEDNFKDDCLYYVAYTRYVQRHYGRAVVAFKKMLTEYPKSPLAAQAKRMLGQADKRLRKARKVDLQWTFNVGVASQTQQLNWSEGLEFGLGANGRVGGQLRWEPRDGVRMNAHVHGTRTSYLTGDLDDREGLVGGLTMTQDLHNTRSLSYGLRYSRNQRVDIATSDTQTYGAWSSYAMPVDDDGRLSLYFGLSNLKYYREASSGTQKTLSLRYSEPLSRTTRLSVGTSFADSDVNAGYLSYSSVGATTSVTRRLSKRRSLRSGLSYTARNFNEPRAGTTEAREDRQWRYFGEYSQRVTKKITLTVGWQETKRSSTQANLNKSSPSWYIRTSRWLDLKF